MFGKAPSPLFGVYSPSVGLNLSPSLSLLYLGASLPLLRNTGVLNEVLHFTSTTLPLLPGQQAAAGAQVPLCHMC